MKQPSESIYSVACSVYTIGDQMNNVEQLTLWLSLLVENKKLHEQLGQINSITALKYTEQAPAKKLIEILKRRGFV